MKRMILAALASTATVVALSGTGCQPTGVGDPCTPEAEYSTAFLGFNYREVSTESADYQCFSRLCLVNHFQGRVSCPYGQDAMMNIDSSRTAPLGCTTPFINAKVDGQNPPGSNNYADPNAKSTVQPQCLDRRDDQAVYCSCRCADVNGRTDDGAVYCTCPSGFTCTQLYSSIGGGADKGLTGAYCIKAGSDYNANSVCAGECNGNTGNCGSAQGVNGM